MKSIRESIEKYFNLSDEDKDELLVQIVKSYQEVVNSRFRGNIDIIELLDYDIQLFIDNDEFEAAQALTDIKEAIILIRKDLI